MKTVGAYITALSSQTLDAATYGALYTDDARLEDLESHDPVSIGRKKIVTDATRLKAGFPDLLFTPELILIDGHHAAVVLRFSGTNSGPFGGKPPTNKQVSFIFMTMFDFSDTGQIRHELHVFPNETFLAQLGLGKGSATLATDWPSKGAAIIATDNAIERDAIAFVAKTDQPGEKHARWAAQNWVVDVVTTSHTEYRLIQVSGGKMQAIHIFHS